MASRRVLPRFGLFVEGAHYTSGRGWDALVALWAELALCHGVQPDRVDVHGFHKGQIVMMAENPGFHFSGTQPLDVQIARAHKARPFDILIVAFDAMPANQELIEPGCLSEIVFLVERMHIRGHLPAQFLGDAGRLLRHYAAVPRPPRTRSYAPRLDVVFMEPEFEALVVCDEQGVRAALDVPARTRDWPKFNIPGQRPKEVLSAAVEFASSALRGRIRGDVKSNRHAWALQIVRTAGRRPRMMAHPIMTRLAALLL